MSDYLGTVWGTAHNGSWIRLENAKRMLADIEARDAELASLHERLAAAERDRDEARNVCCTLYQTAIWHWPDDLVSAHPWLAEEESCR